MQPKIIESILGFLCSFVLFVASCVSHEQTEAQKKLVGDYDYFMSQLESIHPDPYSVYGGKEAFDQKVDSLREALCEDKNLDAHILQQQISRFLIPLHDGHTYCGFMNLKQDAEPRYMPVNFSVASDGFFIWRTFGDYEGLLGAKVNKVGGLTEDQLLDRVSLLMSAENQYGLYKQVLDSNLPDQLLALLLDDFDGQQVELSVTTSKGVDSTLTLPMLTVGELNQLECKGAPVDQRFPSRNFEYKWADKAQGVMTFRCTHVISRDCLSLMRDSGMDYQSTQQWAWGDTPFDSIPAIASQFGAMLKEMKAAGAQHLIIDLRGNGGGWTPILYATLYQLFGDEYLTKNFNVAFETKISEGYLKKNVTTLDELNESQGSHYKMGDFIHTADGDGVFEINDSIRRRIIDGYVCLEKEMLHKQKGAPLYRPKHIYVVTNVATFSAAFHYTFMLWKMGATVVGVPSSQAPNTFMEVTDFALPNSGISCSVSNSIQRFLPIDDSRARVFWPDWMLNYDDYKHYDFDSRSELRYILDHLVSEL